jgi:hypothetical protein
MRARDRPPRSVQASRRERTSQRLPGDRRDAAAIESVGDGRQVVRILACEGIEPPGREIRLDVWWKRQHQVPHRGQEHRRAGSEQPRHLVRHEDEHRCDRLAGLQCGDGHLAVVVPDDRPRVEPLGAEDQIRQALGDELVLGDAEDLALGLRHDHERRADVQRTTDAGARICQGGTTRQVGAAPGQHGITIAGPPPVVAA